MIPKYLRILEYIQSCWYVAMMVCHFLGIGGELVVGFCPSYSAAAASTGRAGAAGFLLLVVYCRR